MELRAARFSQGGGQPPAPGPIAAPGRGKKRPGRGLKGAATAVAASNTSAQQLQVGLMFCLLCVLLTRIKHENRMMPHRKRPSKKDPLNKRRLNLGKLFNHNQTEL